MGIVLHGLKRLTTLTGFMLGLSACAWQSNGIESERMPELDGHSLTRALVVATIESSEELRADEPCVQQFDDILIMCTGRDVRLRLRMEAVVYGDQVDRYVTAYTFSHWGKMPFKPGTDKPQLMLIETDGENFIIPRYSNRPLAIDRAGRLAVPLESPDDLIDWLPCEIGRNRRSMNLVSPVELVRHFKDDNYYSDETFRNAEGYLEQRGEYYWIVRGITVDSIRRVLSSISDPLTQSCDEWPDLDSSKEKKIGLSR